jgi:hypothetical protein
LATRPLKTSRLEMSILMSLPPFPGKSFLNRYSPRVYAISA